MLSFSLLVMLYSETIVPNFDRLLKNMLIRIFKMIATSGFLTALECTILYSLSLLKTRSFFSIAYAVILGNVFSLGQKETGIVITTAHYLRHPGV